MKAQRKSIGRWLAICLGTAAALVSGFYAVLFVLIPEHCDRAETVLASGPHGETLVDKFAACTSLGTSMDERVDLVLSSGKSMPIFRFAPNGGVTGIPGPDGTVKVPDTKLSASWATPHSIKISIGAVAGVLEKQSRVGDYDVAYDIQMNLETYRPRHD